MGRARPGRVPRVQEPFNRVDLERLGEEKALTEIATLALEEVQLRVMAHRKTPR